MPLIPPTICLFSDIPGLRWGCYGRVVVTGRIALDKLFVKLVERGFTPMRGAVVSEAALAWWQFSMPAESMVGLSQLTVVYCPDTLEAMPEPCVSSGTNHSPQNQPSQEYADDGVAMSVGARSWPALPALPMP